MTRRALPTGYATSAGTLVEDFSSTASRTLTGAGSTQEIVTSSLKTGTGSLKIVTGANITTEWRNDAASFSAGNLTALLKVYIPDYSKISSLSFYIAPDNYTNFLVGAYNVGDDSAAAYNGWHDIEFGPLKAIPNWQQTGTVNPNATIDHYKVRITPRSGQVATVIFDGLWINVKARPKILITADDNRGGWNDLALPILDARNLHCTMGIIGTGASAPGGASLMTWAQVQAAYANGHDVGVHGGNSLKALSDTSLSGVTAEIEANRAAIQSRGITRGTDLYIYPFGYNELSTGDTTILTALQNLGFEGGRSAGALLSVPTAAGSVESIWKLGLIGHYRTDSNATITGRLDECVAKGSTAILMFHQVVASGASVDTEINEADFIVIMDYIARLRNLGLADVVTWSEWYAGLSGVRASSGTRLAAARVSAPTRVAA